MKRLHIIVCLCILSLYSYNTHAQSVLVSEYYNMSDPANGEWNELIVVQDNLDMRGMIVSDNNTNQNARQGGVRFKNIDFWKNVRAGTIIGIWHRNYPTNTPADSDAVLQDGRVMLAAADVNYFDQVEFVSGNTWSFNCFNLSRTGDFIEVFNKDTVHIHAIGHKEDQSPGSYWFSMPAPKTNVLALCEDRSSNRVYPGSSLAEYNGPNQEVRTQTCGVYVTRTLPNKDCISGASNAAFWHSLRQPSWASPSLIATPSSNQVLLSWNAMVDPNPSDAIQGYLIVRDSGTSPFVPVDGRLYTANQRIGSAVVLANVGSTVTSYTDNIDLPCGVIYTYRVFAYRYGMDDEYGVNTAASTTRGRQYNRDAYAFHEALKPVGTGPKLQYTAGQTSFCEGSSLNISVPSQPGFTSQWMLNGTDIAGETSLSLVARSSGQYRLKLRNAQGCLVLSDSVDVTVHPLPVVELQPKTLSLCKDSTVQLQATPDPDFRYEWLLNGNIISGATSAVFNAQQSGDYSVRVTNQLTGCKGTSSITVIKALNPSYTLSSSSINFPDLADCVSFADDASLVLSNSSTSDTLTLRVIETAPFSVVSPSFPLVLAPGQSTKVVVRFTPTSSATATQSMQFVSMPCGLTKSVTLSGRKPGLGVGLSSNVSSKDFGTIAWCQKTTVEDSVILSVSQATTVSSIQVDPPFSISAADRSGFTMSAGSSRTIKINFNSLGNPVQVGKKDLVVHFSAGVCTDSIKVNLRGSYTLPQLLVDLASIDFGTLDSCSRISRDTIIQVTNTSSMDIALDQLSDPSLTITDINGNGTLTIPAGATVPITLRFSPNSYSAVVNKQLSFSAKPCLDLSGFRFSGKRAGITVSSTSTDLAFGDVQVCNGVQSTAQKFDLLVFNINGASPTISDIRFSNPLFSSTAVVGQSLADGANSISVSINPNAAPALGSFSETMFITMQPCDVQQQITLSGRFVGQSISLAGSVSKDTLLDFGTTDLTTPVSRSYRIRNNSSFAVTLGTIPTQVGPYTITSNPASGAVLAAGQELQVDVIFTPTQIGSASNVFHIPVVAPCTDSLLCQLFGIGRTQGQNPVPFRFRIGTHTAQVGDVVTIPIEIIGSSLNNRAVTELRTDFDYNTTMLRVNSVSTGPALAGFVSSFSPVQNGVRIQATNGTTLSGEGVAFNVEATVLLGDALLTPLFIDTSSVAVTSTELIASAPDNGALQVQGTCQIGNRLVKVSGTVALMVVSENQKSGTLTLGYETVGVQQTSIELYNIIGERTAVLVDATTQAGLHELQLNTLALPQGRYFITMRSGISVRTLMIDVIR